MITYAAGIDLGTTFASAAIYRDGTTEALDLEDSGRVSPSVIAPFGPPESWLIGSAALAVGPPLARRFKRELGRARLHLGEDQSFTAEELLAAQLRWVLNRLSESIGSPPAAVTLTHPSNWGLDRQGRLKTVATSAGLARFSLLDEPLAAATFFASQTAVETGETVAVYDLGGGTTDITVLRKEADRFVALSNSGTDRGSVDFDDVIIDIIEDRLDGASGFEADELIDAVSEAKIRLSTEAEVTVPVTVGSRQVSIPLTASEVRAAVRSQAASGVNHLATALRQAKVEPDQISMVLLAGGGSGMPLIGELIAELVGREPLIPSWPKMSVAYGAAIGAAAGADILRERPLPRATPRLSEPDRSPSFEAEQRSDAVRAVDRSGFGMEVEEDTPSLAIVVDTTTLTGGPSLVDLQVDSNYHRSISRFVQPPPDQESEVPPRPVNGGAVSTRDALLVALIVTVAVIAAIAVALL